MVGPARTSQAQNLPDAVITASPVSATDNAAIDTFIAGHKPGLTAADPAAIKRARHALCEPAFRNDASESFRRAYSSQIAPIVAPLTTDKRDEVAVNAVRIAGALGTNDGLQLVLKSLTDTREGVRVMASKSVGLTLRFGTGAVGRPALTPRNAQEALDKEFTAAIAAETKPAVLDAMAAALDDCMGASNDKLEGVASRATNMLIAMGSRLAKKPGATPNAYDSVLSHVAQTLVVSMQNKPSAAVAKAAAAVAGDTVSNIVQRIDSGGIADADRSALALTAASCERIVQLAAQSLGSQAVTYGLEPKLLEGKDAEFKDAAKRLLTDLAGAPFK